jgi:uncharacterized protein
LLTSDQPIIISSMLSRIALFSAFSIILGVACHGQTSAAGPILFEKAMNALAGSSASRSSANAIEYFRRSADLGFAPAQTALGYLYETGHATTADPAEAFRCYKKAASQGDPLAEWLVGSMIFAGEVPPRDLNDAAAWLRKSSAQDNPFAKYLLGRIALERRDYSRAAGFFREAAEQGLPQAQRHFALLLSEGEGVPLDLSIAYAWMLVSSESGLQINSTELQALEANLSSTEIERAKRIARDLGSTTARSVVGHGCTGWQGEFADIPTPPPPDIQRFCR